MTAPLILDLDGSVGDLPGATRIALAEWQEAVRFGCGLATFRRFRAALEAALPAAHGTVFLGSGDFHHLTWPLVERLRTTEPFTVVVFDNHPDNMRFPFGIHCGSWVRWVALLPQVARVEVLGITSGDVSRAHAWENHLAPLRRGKLRYWTIGVDTGWSRRLGLGAAFLGFDDPAALIARFSEEQAGQRGPVYLSIDKDVFAPEVARTNWDQGITDEAQVAAGIAALAGRIVASDVNGEVSFHRYRSWWKRRLSALDEQPVIDPAVLPAWQAEQHALNGRLLERIAAASRAPAA